MDKVLTIWKNGDWLVWKALDAHYAANDLDWLCNIKLKDIVSDEEAA